MFRAVMIIPRSLDLAVLHDILATFDSIHITRRRPPLQSLSG
jgi:hypothetical protein